MDPNIVWKNHIAKIINSFLHVSRYEKVPGCIPVLETVKNRIRLSSAALFCLRVSSSGNLLNNKTTIIIFV